MIIGQLASNKFHRRNRISFSMLKIVFMWIDQKWSTTFLSSFA